MSYVKPSLAMMSRSFFQLDLNFLIRLDLVKKVAEGGLNQPCGSLVCSLGHPLEAALEALGQYISMYDVLVHDPHGSTSRRRFPSFLPVAMVARFEYPR